MGNTWPNLALSFLLVMSFQSFLPTFSMKLTRSITTDQAALLALKDHITHDPHNLLTTNWSTSTPVCNWIGVSCGSKHRRVTALNISRMGLVGTLPPHLGNLSFLSLLYITNNSFHGPLPLQLANLQRLEYLGFGNNSFSEEIPSWFGSFTKLRRLFLYGNSFKGVIPFSLGNLSKLEVLSLYENHLSGSIPSSIFNISSLQEINLSHNELSGSIPSPTSDLISLYFINFNFNNLTGHIPENMFDHLPKLELLLLSGNLLSGSIPTSLFKCTELQALSLSINLLEGNLPVEIGNLSMLQICYLNDNQFQGKIPEQIGNLTVLTELSCRYNNFTGTIPQQIGNLKNIEFLSLEENNIAGPIPPAIFNSSALMTVSFEGNQLSGHLPSTFGLWLPNLEVLYLADNELTGSIPISISNASQLTQIDMQMNSFSGYIPHNLGYLTELQYLSLNANNLTSKRMSFLSSLTRCRDLYGLQFDGNPLISGKIPTLIGNLSGSLQYLSASGCNIYGSIPDEIGNLSALINLELANNKLTGRIPGTIGHIMELQNFSLEDNELDGVIPSELCQLKKLAFLFLTSNKLFGTIPECLGDLISLRKLLLGSNRFRSSIPSSLTELQDLLILNLSSNSLTGPLPISIAKWKVVTDMDLSNNEFSSEIPTGIGDLKDLTHFSLSNNRINGSIPESFAELFSLEFLDLSRNNLSGEIPKTLQKLSYLKYFNVSFNRLQGEIPHEGSFANYSAESFKGNEALCGAAQLGVPSCKSTKPRRNSKAATKLIMYVLVPIASTILVLALIIIFFRTRKRKANLSTDQEDVVPVGTRRRISYYELSQATDGFNESRLLGTGSFGSVYQGTLSDGMRFAVKVFKLELERAFKSFDIECEVLSSIRHRNLIKIISSCSNLDFKALVLEFMPNGSLDKWLYSNNHFLDILQRLNIMIDVASALEYLHHGHPAAVVHCDLKPSNVLLDEDMVAHLSDFGIAKLLCDEDSIIQTMTMATIGYMAPEYGTEGIISTKGDVYSFGILMMETFTRKKPTDEMFVGEISLKGMVKESLSSSTLNQVVDTNLLSTEDHRGRFAINNCTLSIFQVSLECSADSPDERLEIKEIAAKLKKIKVKFLKDVERVR